MKLEQQVCSLELAKRLKELGVSQESLFDWNWSGKEGEMAELIYWNNRHDHNLVFLYSAFTVAELFNIAPASTSMLKRTDVETDTVPRYYVETFKHYRDSDWNENPADALAKMLIYLLENNLT